MSTTTTASKIVEVKTYSLPKYLWVFWFISMPGTIFFTSRMIYEQTYLTWQEGPQMIGFSLAHTGPILELGISLFIATLWLCISFALILNKSINKHRINNISFSVLIGTFVIVMLLFVPYGIWQTIMIQFLGPGDHGTELLTYFAATGDKTTVRTLLSKGIDINATSNSEKTALMSAAVAGQLDIVEYLIEKGANINMKDNDGQTALDHAIGSAHSQVAEILRKHGGTSQYY